MMNRIKNNRFSGYWLIFLGLFFVSFHIYYGTAAVLPPVVGYLLVFLGLSSKRESNRVVMGTGAKKVCGGMVLLSFLNLFLPYVMEKIPVLSLISLLWTALYSIVYLMLVYQLMAGSVRWLRSVGREDTADKVTKRVYVYLLLFLIWTLGRLLVEISLYDLGNTVVQIAFILLQIWFLTIFLRVKKSGQKKYEEKETDTDKAVEDIG